MFQIYKNLFVYIFEGWEIFKKPFNFQILKTVKFFKFLKQKNF
jgi:hypothetical protein